MNNPDVKTESNNSPFIYSTKYSLPFGIDATNDN